MVATRRGVCGPCVVPHVAKESECEAESVIHLRPEREENIVPVWEAITKQRHAMRPNVQ